MKEKFIKPELDIILFSVQDDICIVSPGQEPDPEPELPEEEG